MIEIVAISGAISGGLALLITTCCFNIRRLRCANISCCGAQCTRDVMNTDELAADGLEM